MIVKSDVVSGGLQREIAIKSTKLSEADLLVASLNLLNFYRAQRKLVYRRLNVGGVVRSGRGGKIFMTKNHGMTGMSDLLIWIRNGPAISVELKATKGSQSEAQKHFEGELESVGHCYFVVRSLDELETLLKAYGVK